MSRRCATSRFYFIKPRKNSNAAELAEKLIALKPVEEVFLTEGDYGFVVKVKITGGKEPSDVADYISKNIGCSHGNIVSHYEYVK